MKDIKFGNRIIGENYPTFIIAEISANHNQSFDKAVEIIKAAKEAGADAVKVQTYTADTITLNCNSDDFLAHGLWEGQSLYDLYSEAYTPWEWQPKLKEIAEKEGLEFFSSPFDFTAVDFLENMNVPAYKVASFEITDIPLIKYMASKMKPMIMSTGIARLSDIDEAVRACRDVGNNNIILLKCTSAYPAPMEEANLRVIPNMIETFDVTVGLSDHTFGRTVPLGAVALGAKVVEKHLIMKRSDGGPDSGFSMEFEEFKEMVKAIRDLEKAIGKVAYDLTDKQIKSREHSRSLYVSTDVKKGDIITRKNVRSVRPGFGMATKHIDEILGKKFRNDYKMGTRMKWNMVE
ncbi:MAG: pseudaminic acid synthase [Tissierellia bacterium]|nr:pseudaminic acid synthase [Tissierellia bacterium]